MIEKRSSCCGAVIEVDRREWPLLRTRSSSSHKPLHLFDKAGALKYSTVVGPTLSKINENYVDKDE